MKPCPARLCQTCNRPIPGTIEINDKKIYRSSRINCYECVPYGEGLHGSHEIRRRPQRICTRCGLEYRYTRNATHDLCQNCKRKKFLYRRKGRLLKRLGGRCSLCGYDKCIAALDFHHIDPTQKEFNISRNFGKKLTELLEEVDKCVILCSNCHREVHFGFSDL